LTLTDPFRDNAREERGAALYNHCIIEDTKIFITQQKPIEDIYYPFIVLHNKVLLAALFRDKQLKGLIQLNSQKKK
jgi:hypothetical protein